MISLHMMRGLGIDRFRGPGPTFSIQLSLTTVFSAGETFASVNKIFNNVKWKIVFSDFINEITCQHFNTKTM